MHLLRKQGCSSTLEPQIRIQQQNEGQKRAVTQSSLPPQSCQSAVSSNCMKSLHNYTLLLMLSCLIACKQASYDYPRNRQIANEKGILNDSLGFYFTAIEPLDSSQVEFVKNSTWQNNFSVHLYAFKEPILYNDYLGKERYRFLWLRSFHSPMVFIIANDNGNITLTTKKLDRRPRYRDDRYVNLPYWDSTYSAMGYQLIKEVDTLEDGKSEIVTVIKGDRKANIIYNSTKLLSTKDWRRFEKLLNEANFWNEIPFDWAAEMDGATWVIEANTKKRYKYIVRQSPGGKLREAGKFLIELSGLNEEIY